MSSKSHAARRLETALDLADLAAEMFVQRLRREHPELSEAELRARLAAWYEERPGAPYGDADGQPGSWPRDPS